MSQSVANLTPLVRVNTHCLNKYRISSGCTTTSCRVAAWISQVSSMCNHGWVEIVVGSWFTTIAGSISVVGIERGSQVGIGTLAFDILLSSVGGSASVPATLCALIPAALCASSSSGCPRIISRMILVYSAEALSPRTLHCLLSSFYPPELCIETTWQISLHAPRTGARSNSGITS